MALHGAAELEGAAAAAAPNGVKVLLIGDSGVGKTSLILNFCEGKEAGQTAEAATISTDFLTKDISVGGQTYPLQVWDTAGQERFRTITSTYYKSAQGIVVVFDTACEQSFRNAGQWLQEVERYGSTDVCKMLVGTKADLMTQRVVDTDVARDYASSLGLPYFETSSKTGTGVAPAFERLVEEIQRGAGGSAGLPLAAGGDATAAEKLRGPAPPHLLVHRGWLTKRGGRFPHRWQSRFFVVSSESLTYSKTRWAHARLKGTIYLNKITLIVRKPDPLHFDVVTRARTYRCRALSPRERRAWIDSIERAAKKRLAVDAKS